MSGSAQRGGDCRRTSSGSLAMLAAMRANLRLRLTAIMPRHEYPKRRGKRNIHAFMLINDTEQSAQRHPARISDFTEILPELRLKR